jgi:uncharacterized protein YciI
MEGVFSVPAGAHSFATEGRGCGKLMGVRFRKGDPMYALAIIRYRRPLEEVLKVVESHRAYLQGLKGKGILLASGPLDPRNGGALLLRVPEDDSLVALDRIRDDDPFTKAGVGQYELLPWLPNIGKEQLDNL